MNARLDCIFFALGRSAAALALLGLGACAALSSAMNAAPKTVAPDTAANPASGACNAGLDAAESTRLALIQKMIDDGKPYAALANLDGSPAYPMVHYLRAESLRKTGQAAAATREYQALLGTCYDGFGEHGLGLIAAEGGNLGGALPHLRATRERRPTDARIRNDYGYALMLNHDYRAARIEFMTAIELDPANKLASANLARLDELANPPGLPATGVSAPSATAQASAMALLPAESLAVEPVAPPRPVTSPVTSQGTLP